MKRYYYDDGSKTNGPFNKEELLLLDLSDETSIFDEIKCEYVALGDIKSGKYSEDIDSESMNNNDKISREKDDKSKSSRITRLIIMFVISLLLIKFMPVIVVKIFENVGANGNTELFENENLQDACNLYQSYSDGNFSFDYPSTYKITKDTVILNRHHISLQSKDGLLLVNYTKVPNEYNYTTEEKCDLCIYEIEGNGKYAVQAFSNNIEFGDIVGLDEIGPVVKYKIDFSFSDYKGFILSALGNQYAYTVTVVTDNIEVLQKLKKTVEEINVE